MGGPGRTILVGDVHGCAEELAELLVLLHHRPSKDRLILLGDLFDRGPDPLAVLDIIGARKVEVLRGNHDHALLRALKAEEAGEAPPRLLPSQKACLDLLAARKDEVRALIRSAPLAISSERFIAVHAGIHPDRGLLGTTGDLLMNLRRLEDRPGKPYWYEVYPPGDRVVVFGHIASRNAIARFHEDRRTILGIDTACVYGNRLTAYVIEDDSLVSVPARRRYCPTIEVPLADEGEPDAEPPAARA